MSTSGQIKRLIKVGLKHMIKDGLKHTIKHALKICPDWVKNAVLAWYAGRRHQRAGGDQAGGDQHVANFSILLGGRRYRLVPGNDKFWRQAGRGQWEAETFQFIEQLLRPDAVYVDVGAWIGPTVLFAAPRCRTVYCLEPDAVAYERLLGNLRMNGIANVLPLHGALHSTNGSVPISSESGLGDSVTRVRAAPSGSEAGVEVATALAVTLPRFIEWWGIERMDLMKIDIEGGEFDVVEALIALPPHLKPSMHLSLHAPLFPLHERAAKLAAIVKLAQHYAYCYDRGGCLIQPADILQEPYVSRFREVVLTDEAL